MHFLGHQHVSFPHLNVLSNFCTIETLNFKLQASVFSSSVLKRAVDASNYLCMLWHYSFTSGQASGRKILRTRKFFPSVFFLRIFTSMLSWSREAHIIPRTYCGTQKSSNLLSILPGHASWTIYMSECANFKNAHISHASHWTRPTFLYWCGVPNPLSLRILPDFTGTLRTDPRADPVPVTFIALDDLVTSTLPPNCLILSS